MPSRDLTPFLDARQNQLQLEVSAGDAIDTKALGILATDFAILLFIAQSSSINMHARLIVDVLVLSIISLVLTCIAIVPRKYAGASTNMFDHPEYLTFRTGRLVKQLISDTEIAILTNNKINKQRWTVCSIALVLTLVGSGILFCVLYFN
jgi:hypothetical protein